MQKVSCTSRTNKKERKGKQSCSKSTSLSILTPPNLSMESIDRLLMSKALTTAKLFFRLPLDVSLGEPWGVAMGVAAVWVIIGGGLRGPRAGGGWLTSFTFPVLSSLVIETDGGRPNICNSGKKRQNTTTMLSSRSSLLHVQQCDVHFHGVGVMYTTGIYEQTWTNDHKISKQGWHKLYWHWSEV